MSNLRQNLTEDELEELRKEKPLILNVCLDFQTALKLNEMFDRDQKKIDDYIKKCIDYMQYLPFEWKRGLNAPIFLNM